MHRTFDKETIIISASNTSRTDVSTSIMHQNFFFMSTLFDGGLIQCDDALTLVAVP